MRLSPEVKNDVSRLEWDAMDAPWELAAIEVLSSSMDQPGIGSLARTKHVLDTLMAMLADFHTAL